MSTTIFCYVLCFCQKSNKCVIMSSWKLYSRKHVFHIYFCIVLSETRPLKSRCGIRFWQLLLSRTMCTHTHTRKHAPTLPVSCPNRYHYNIRFSIEIESFATLDFYDSALSGPVAVFVKPKHNRLTTIIVVFFSARVHSVRSSCNMLSLLICFVISSHFREMH